MVGGKLALVGVGPPSLSEKAGRPLGKRPEELEACQSVTALTFPKKNLPCGAGWVRMLLLEWLRK